MAAGSPTNVAPSLGLALNSPALSDPKVDIDTSVFDPKSPTKPANSSTPALDKTHIQTICKHINDRLFAGLSEAFQTPEGQGDLFEDNEQPPHPTEESWAQTITAMLFGVPYGGPGQEYQLVPGHKNQDDDGRFIHAVQAGKSYPIVLACQHLCDMAMMTRGYEFKTGPDDFGKDTLLPKNGLVTAGDSTAAYEQNIVPPPSPGKWVKPSAFGVTDRVVTMSRAVEKGLSPGDVLAFADKANANDAHIAFVLRRHPTADSRVQFFDTGALNAPNFLKSEEPVVYRLVSKSVSDGCTSDYNWAGTSIGDENTAPDPAGPLGKKKTKERLTVVIRGPEKCVGMGLLNPSGQVSRRPDLDNALTKTQGAFPLGFARLILDWRPTGEVLFAGPLVRMHSGSENFHISRYLFSLRFLPGRDHIRATWIIQIPRRDLATAALDGNRDDSIADLLKAIPSGKFKSPTNAGQQTDPVDANGVIHRDLLATVIVVSDVDDDKKPNSFKDGLVGIEERFRSTKKGLFANKQPLPNRARFSPRPFNKATGSVVLNATDFTGFEYLRGDFSDPINEYPFSM